MLSFVLQVCLKNKHKKLCCSFCEVFGGTRGVHSSISTQKTIHLLFNQLCHGFCLPCHRDCPRTGHSPVPAVRSSGLFSLLSRPDFSAAFDVALTTPSFSKWFPPFALMTLRRPGFFQDITGSSFQSSQLVPLHIQPLSHAVSQPSFGGSVSTPTLPSRFKPVPWL